MLGMHTYVGEHRRLPGNFSVLSQKGECGKDWFEWESWLGLRYSWDYGKWFNKGSDPPHSTVDLWAWVEETVPHKGSLYKYVKDAGVYLCPKDKRGSPDSESPTGGGGNGVFSYTMNYLIGYANPDSLTSFRYVRDFTQCPVVLPPIQPNKPTIKAGTRIVWSASEMIVLMEEHPWNNTNQSIPEDNLGHSSYLVMRHFPRKTDGKGMFAFLDGHTEAKRYPYEGKSVNPRDPNKPKLQGLDICNQYQYPYDYCDRESGLCTDDDGENEEAFIYRIR
jgi:prepilin-type processing-associated H-X9-DG protein